MNNISNLTPYVISASISGCINALIAWHKLEKRCRYLLFYQPLKTFIFWIWLLMQILIPAVFFWFMVIKACPEKPHIDVGLITNVLVYGIFFQLFSDTTEKLGITPVNVIIPLTWFDSFFYQKLLSKERVRSSIFWNNLAQELTNITDLSPGINYLKREYFDEIFFNQNVQEYQYFQNKLAEISQENDINRKCEQLMSTCFKGIIPRQDLREVLKQFPLSDDFIDEYFK